MPNKDVGSYNLRVIFRTKIAAYTQLADTAETLGELLTEGLSSVLMSALRTDTGLVYGVSCEVSPDHVDPNLSYFEILTTVKGKNLIAVTEKILEVLGNIESSISHSQLTRLDNHLATAVLDDATSRAPSHFAEQYSSEVPWNLGVKTFKQRATELKKSISKEKLNRIAKKIFKNSKLLIAYSGKKRYPAMEKLRL